VQTSDGGIALAGSSNSYSHDVPGDTDFLVYRLDAAGNKLWRQNYGGAENEPIPGFEGQRLALKATADGGFVLAGSSFSFGPPGMAKIVVYKLDGSGAIQWREILGDFYSDVFGEILEFTD